MNNTGLTDSVMSTESYVYKASIHLYCSQQSNAFNSKRQILIKNLNKIWHEIIHYYCDKVNVQCYLHYLNETLTRTIGFQWLG